MKGGRLAGAGNILHPQHRTTGCYTGGNRSKPGCIPSRRAVRLPQLQTGPVYLCESSLLSDCAFSHQFDVGQSNDRQGMTQLTSVLELSSHFYAHVSGYGRVCCADVAAHTAINLQAVALENRFLVMSDSL